MSEVEYRWSMYLWVAAGGALGSGLRFATSVLWLGAVGSGFPWPILLVNVLGSLLIGYLAAVSRPGGRWAMRPEHQVFMMAGFCGGLTTFSFVSLELALMIQVEDWIGAAWYLALSLAGWLSAVWLGYRLGNAKGLIAT